MLMMLETLKYLGSHQKFFLVRGISNAGGSSMLSFFFHFFSFTLCQNGGNIEAVQSVFMVDSENQQSHKSGSSDIIMTRFFLFFFFNLHFCFLFFLKSLVVVYINLNENLAFFCHLQGE